MNLHMKGVKKVRSVINCLPVSPVNYFVNSYNLIGDINNFMLRGLNVNCCVAVLIVSFQIHDLVVYPNESCSYKMLV